jgi:hypothetical protein
LNAVEWRRPCTDPKADAAMRLNAVTRKHDARRFRRRNTRPAAPDVKRAASLSR